MIPVTLPGKGSKRPRKFKYGNRKVREADGNVIDSTKEAWRKRDLQLLARTGEIQNLRFQVEFLLIPEQVRDDGKKERPCCYIADAVYDRKGERVVEDTKSEITRKNPDYVIKRKLMLLMYGISILEC